MQSPADTESKPESRFTFLRVFREVFCVGAILLLALVSPFLFGRYCGYGWGLLAAVADMVGWLYVNQKYFGKNRLALSTRLIWFLGLAYIVFAAVFEGAHFFH